uniref:Protein sprint n=1 Tax=Anopheles albimanus TaxID=7167 RepID=A0A182F7S8_ANOAL
MESETDDNCYERKDIPVDRFVGGGGGAGEFYHSRDVTTRQLNRHLVHCTSPELSPLVGGGPRPISLPAKLTAPEAGSESTKGERDTVDSADGTASNNGIDSGSLIRRYAEVTKFKPDSPTSGSTRSSLALAKKRLSALHSSVQQPPAHQQHDHDDDDLAPLLAGNRELSQEELYESHTSLVSSSEGGIMAEGEETSSDESEQTEDSANHSACVLSLVERLLRTHPVWFLPGIQRSGAVHLLQGKEEGNFIVRGSSQSKTMAVSVRLPKNAGPYIEHYLIQSNNGLLSLESSRFKFDSIPALIAHYTQCCDELPVQLCLPAALREAKNRQQLSSLALLGQEFWRYPMASSSPKPKPNPPITAPPLSANSSHMNTPSEATHSSGIGISVLNHTPTTTTTGGGLAVGSVFGSSAVTPVAGASSAGPAAMFGDTPTDTFSTVSGFTVSNNGQTLLSPESIDSAIMLSPMDPTQHQQQQQTGIIGKTSTFKTRKQIFSPATPLEVEKQIELFNANILGQTVVPTTAAEPANGEQTFTSTLEVKNLSTLERKPRAPRPTPPNTLNIKPIRSPPAPPARRINIPLTESSPTVEGSDMFTPKHETPTLTPVGFPVDSSFQRKDLPTTNNVTTTPTVAGNSVWYTDRENVGEQTTNVAQTISHPQMDQFGSLPMDTACITIPTSTRVSRRNKRKESKHYQESDILDSPAVYCRSTLGDKISDYEDIWSQDAAKSDRRSLLASRHAMYGHDGYNDSTLKGLVSPSIESMHRKLSYKPGTHGAPTFSVDNLAFGSADSASDRGSTPTDKPGRPTMVLKTFSPMPKDADQTPNSTFDLRQRSCLNIAHHSNAGTPLALEETKPQLIQLASGTGGGHTQDQKQNSPFYADPADIMSSIIRRSPLNRLASSNSSQRHSEPPKQLLLLSNEDSGLPNSCSVAAHPWGNGNGYHANSNFAASLDELALEKGGDTMLVGVRLNELSIGNSAPPPVSTGSLVNDYDSDIRWKTPTGVCTTFKGALEQCSKSIQRSTDSLTTRPLTVHQIIARKLPQLNLSDRLLEGALLSVDAHSGGLGVESGSGTLGNRTQRKSAYDNVERQVNAYASSAVNSSHSDDGTVFSEPWDSSQWDSFFPNEQSSIQNTICENVNSCTKDTRYRKETQPPQPTQQKVATILRTRSCRDREILSGEGQESVSNGKHCSLRLPDDWCRIELDDCQLSPLSAPSAPELVTASCPDFYRNCSIMVGSDDCVTERSNDRTVDANVEQLFGLDEQGNIIINVGHIEEQRGRALLVKRRYRKIFSGLDHGLEIDEATRFDGMWQKLMHKLFVCCEETLVGGHPRNRNSHTGPGESIATYAFYLANKLDSTFSRNISNFIACTKESKTAPHPQVVMRNMRQFMSGMKNYLVKHGEGDFAAEVQKARAQLKSDEFLNLDSILEEVMHKLVILPLREHLYGLFVDYYSQSGDIQLIVEKVRSTAGRSPAAFGIKGNVIPPSAAAMRQIATLFVRLQEAELPLVKLDLLLAAVSAIFEGTTCLNGQQLSADDFLPVLVMVVAHCGFVGAEIEAEYMWGLLQPSLLSGEAGYYLTALCSAVHVLKNFKFNEQEGGTSTLDWDSSTMPNCSSVLRVIIPDEYNGSIQTRTLPIRPHTTTKEVCRIIAHKARITNAQDYGLFKLIDGEETLLHDTECPQDVRMTAKGKHFMIAYKRIDAKIAWPTVTPNTATVAGSNATTNANVS